MEISRVVVQRFVRRDLSREFDLPTERSTKIEKSEGTTATIRSVISCHFFLAMFRSFVTDYVSRLLHSDFVSEIFFSSLGAKAPREGRRSVEASLVTQKDVNPETVLPRVAK